MKAKTLRALDDTLFFLPYVRALLFPETEKLGQRTIEQQIGHLQILAKESIEVVAKDLSKDGVLRFNPRCKIQAGF